ncbi:PilW family protein [Patescibacteria group bacterium]
MKKQAYHRQGFSLIEIIVVISILTVVLATGTSIFYTILKNTTKARIVAEVKQNGDFAISSMEREIRSSKNAEVIDLGLGLTITTLAGGEITFNCVVGDEINRLELGVPDQSLTSRRVMPSNCTDAFFVTEGVEGSSADLVEIKFTLSQFGTSTRTEEATEINFNKTVSLRNYYY